jgi:hypothetical protein
MRSSSKAARHERHTMALEAAAPIQYVVAELFEAQDF